MEQANVEITREPEGDLNVLLVDDHAPVLRFLAAAFKRQGCVVSTASSAEEALDLISERGFDLVVSDIKMPGLSGLDLLRTVRGQQPDTPVVLITGMPSVDSAVFGLRHQAYDYLTKPFSMSDVQDLVGRVRHDRSTRASGQQAEASQRAIRRQFGMEALSRLGELALQGLDTTAFVERALGYTLEALGGDAALILLVDEDGRVSPSQTGDLSLAVRLLGASGAALQGLSTGAMRGPVTVIELDAPSSALATLIQVMGRPAGILCLARHHGAEFVSDDREFLRGYARTIALSLEKMQVGEDVEGNLIDTISAFVIALESKDAYLKGHSTRVSLYAAEIARALGLSPAEVAVASRSGMLHDLGKLVVMDSILQKPARLTTEEFAVMREHPENAARILQPFRFLAREAEAIKGHHERFDGKGYPQGLKGEDIPIAARIITVADAFDAMTSNRPYRGAMPIEVAAIEITRHAQAQFDPRVTEAFSRIPLARLAEISRLYDGRPELAAPAPAAGPAPAPAVNHMADALLAASIVRGDAPVARC
jgi:response regulator RpfG family c-di-GMP phosphodiesterase